MIGERWDITRIGPCYGLAGPRWRQPFDDVTILALVVLIAGAVTVGDALLGFILGAAVAAVVLSFGLHRSRWLIMLFIVLGAVAGGRADRAWQALGEVELGPHRGWAVVVDDPRSVARSQRVVVEVDGQRFEMWNRDPAMVTAIAQWRVGEQVHLIGERRALDPERAARLASLHIVGRYRLIQAGPISPGTAMLRSGNAVRAAVDRASQVLGVQQAALYRGLVIGDRRDQPPEMVDRFRSTGLSHLVVVSGLNVSLLLIAAGPVLRRFGPLSRWLMTLGLVGWFVLLARAEPSIVRAGAMAAISVTAYTLGRDRDPGRVLCLAVAGLLLADPLLHRSVGWWLSVGATAGVCELGPRIARRLQRWGPLAVPVGITVGAQVGVTVPLWWAFGSVPLVSVPANLLAVPVASAVKLYGLPAGILAGFVPHLAPVVMAPVRIGVWWVDGVARIAARLEPPDPVPLIGWLLAIMLFGAWLARSRCPAATTRDDGGPPASR